MTMPSPPPIKVLAYADDALVVLRNPTEFEHLQDIINQYMAASNASLNYNQGITSWHDRTATEPLTYLGFAICSSANQRATYALSIISKIRAYCQLHSTRALTYRGRVTVINALLYSKLWHVMRLFTFSSPELKQLQRLAATFINRGSKISRLAFDHLTQPINQGGLELLDPATQANALQWRWLYFLIHPPQASPSLMPSIPILRYTLNFVLSTAEYPSYHWSFLFPHCRLVIPRLFGPIVNLLRAVDSIPPHNYHFSHATMSTCLHLPLMELLVHNLPPTHPIAHLFQSPHYVLKNQPTIRQLKGSDIFIFNPNRLCLEYNHLSPALPHGPSINKTISLLCSNQLLLNNFVLYNFLPNVPRPHNALEVHNLPNSNIPSFSALHSFVTTLLIPPEPNNIRPTTKATSIKYFKCLLTSSSPPTPSSILSSTQWPTATRPHIIAELNISQQMVQVKSL
ncbi:uncharacterized protein ATC70_001759 [Mucor velutinosus]|uniref:Reverse transcriptase domain-containing protein n=1 Tax=Mucor velutinosus TaxID=708070 RepID=A0AAN7DB35_9FUNG|nr:hypothetical protein ATC70_001759 [Mucor velutinosus]